MFLDVTHSEFRNTNALTPLPRTKDWGMPEGNDNVFLKAIMV